MTEDGRQRFRLIDGGKKDEAGDKSGNGYEGVDRFVKPKRKFFITQVKSSDDLILYIESRGGKVKVEQDGETIKYIVTTAPTLSSSVNDTFKDLCERFSFTSN